MQQKKANTFYSCCPQPFWQGQMPNTVEQITGNQSCLKQDVICPKLIASNAGSSKIILSLFDYLFDYCALVVFAPNVFSLELKIGYNYFITPFKNIEKQHLFTGFGGRQTAFDYGKPSFV